MNDIFYFIIHWQGRKWKWYRFYQTTQSDIDKGDNYVKFTAPPNEEICYTKKQVKLCLQMGINHDPIMTTNQNYTMQWCDFERWSQLKLEAKMRAHLNE